MLRLLPLSKYGQTLASLVGNRFQGESRFPFYASFKLTRRCHFACRFCNIKDDTREDLPTEAVKKVMDNLSRSSVILTSFEGGEPLLRKDIGELLAYARQCRFYLLFTTSERHLERYPMKEYARYIDFLHISMDEGHDNLKMFDELETFAAYGTRLAVQMVVERETLAALETKIERCSQVGARAVVMPAVHMERTENRFPDLDACEQELRRLKKKYPATVYTPDGYFSAVRQGTCSSASIIVDSDGALYYPCHIREEKGPNLIHTDLMDWLRTPEAQAARKRMAACTRNCGWFQYFSITDFVSPLSVWRSLAPLLR